MQFNTSTFIGGMVPIIPDASKIPNGAYRIARNVRVRDNIVTPAAEPVDLTKNLPFGSIQGGHEMGMWVIVFIAGIAYARHLSNNNQSWVPLAGYRINQSVNDIYTEVVPMAFNTFKRNNNGATDTSIPQIANGFYNDQGGGIPCLVAQDGINQPMLIHPDASGLSFTCRAARTYADWTPDNPEYVPIGKQMVWDGARLHIALNGRFRYEKQRLVGKSVNNRPLDFMVVLDSDGNKLVDETQGDARITSYGVDFDEITALRVVNNSQPAVIVATQKNLWQAVPDYTQIDQTFGEPVYRPVFISGTGAVSQNAFAETTINTDAGSTAFVSQSGIRAINAAAQNKYEGRNYPLSREVSPLLADITQAYGAAIQFNDYTYFALTTTLGFATLIYDSVLSKWVSVDKYALTDNGIFKFLVVREPGRQRLLALTRTKVLAMEEAATYSPGIYLGDYSSTNDDLMRVEQVPTRVYVNYINEDSAGTFNVTVFCDERIQQTLSGPLAVSPPLEHGVFPYDSHADNANSTSLSITAPIVECFRHGYWITWNTSASLSYLCVDAVASKNLTNIEQRIRTFNS